MESATPDVEPSLSPAMPPPLPAQPPPLPLLQPDPVWIPDASIYVTPAQPLGPGEADQFIDVQPPSELQMLASVATETVRLPVRRRQASLAVRAGAFGLDIVFVALMMLVVICIIAIFVHGLDWFDDRQILLILLVFYPIYSLAEVFGPATVGKVIFGVHITDPQGAPSGRPARLRRWPLRNLPIFVVGMALAIPAIWNERGATFAGLPVSSWNHLMLVIAGTLLAIDLLMVLPPGGRTLHERLSDTGVYYDIGGTVQYTRVEMTEEEMGIAHEPDGAADAYVDTAATELVESERTATESGAAEDAALAQIASPVDSDPLLESGTSLNASDETRDPEQDLAELAAARAYAPPRQIRPARFSTRLIATIVDFGLLMVLSGTIVPILMFIVATLLPRAGVLLIFVPMTVLMAYVGCEVWAAASPGKFLVGMRITAASTHPAGVGARIVRAALKNIPFLTVLCLGTLLILVDNMSRVAVQSDVVDMLATAARWISIGGVAFYFVSCLFVLTPSRRSLHDLASGTAVYEDIELTAARVRGAATPTAFEVRVNTISPSLPRRGPG